jgi:hypothetical protein
LTEYLVDFSLHTIGLEMTLFVCHAHLIGWEMWSFGCMCHPIGWRKKQFDLWQVMQCSRFSGLQQHQFDSSYFAVLLWFDLKSNLMPYQKMEFHCWMYWQRHRFQLQRFLVKKKV